MSLIIPSTIVVQVPGTLAAGPGAARVQMPVAGRMKDVTVSLGGNSGAGTTTVDVNLGGASVLAAPVALNSGVQDSGVVSAGGDAFDAGDVVTVDIDGVTATPAPSDLAVAISYWPQT